MQDAKKVLVLSSTYPSLNSQVFQPGFVHLLCKNLKKLGYKIDVLAPYIEGALPIEHMDGVKIYRYRYFFKKLSYLTRSGGIIGNISKNPFLLMLVPFLIFAQFFCLLRLLKNQDYDFIHAHWIFPQGFLALLVKKILRKNVAIVCASHGGDLFFLKSKFFKVVNRLVIKNVDGFHVVGQHMKTYCTEVLGVEKNKIDVISMGIDNDIFNFIGSENTRKSNQILFVGRLVEKKGLDLLLSSMVKLRTDGVNVTLKIAGDGPLGEQYKNFVSDNFEEGIVDFIGAVKSDILSAYYKEATLLVVPSKKAKDGDQEGLGLVVIEAMACGCPVLVSDHSAFKDTVQAMKTGAVFSLDYPDDLNNKIQILINNAELRKQLAINGLEKSKEYGIENIAKKIDFLYARSLEKKSSARSAC
jgi:glycosyltransferase involved in cell wall biosynthesis